VRGTRQITDLIPQGVERDALRLLPDERVRLAAQLACVMISDAIMRAVLAGSTGRNTP
jgi:hypothetical protein